MSRTYRQNCPIAKGLDVLGERWTLLILRELVGGARRYADLRSALPGIATNLLADRLRELEDAGLVERTELPPPVARTVYTLSEVGWVKVLPVIRAVAQFGLEMVEPADDAVTPLNGFLVGFLLGFDDASAEGVDATYRVEIDGRHFEFAVRDGRLGVPAGPPAVTMSAAATDLIALRLASNGSQRKAALGRLRFDGQGRAVTTFRKIFNLN